MGTLLIAILAGIAIAAITLIVIAVLTIRWIKNKICEKMKEKKEHRDIAVVDMKTATVQPDIKEQIDNSDEMSMDDLEKLCEDEPYFVAVYNEETDEVESLEGFKATHVDENVKKLFRDKQGIIVFDE